VLFLSEVFRITICMVSIQTKSNRVTAKCKLTQIVTSVHSSCADTIEIARKYRR